MKAKTLQERLVAIVEGLYGFDPLAEEVDGREVFAVDARPSGGKLWRIEQRYPPTAVAGFAITINGHAWAVTFEDNVIVDSEQDDIGVSVEVDGVVDEDVSLDDAPDDVIRAFLIAQANRILESTQRLLKIAAEPPQKAS